MIHLSPSAVNEVKRLRSKQHHPNILFRLQIQQGGCSGLFYDLAFDSLVNSTDQLYDCNGIALVIDLQSLKYVNGMTIDYSEDLMGGGFRFYNPYAIALCSCGNSFSIGTSSKS